MGPPRVIGGYADQMPYVVTIHGASMGPPRVIGGYVGGCATHLGRLDRFNGAAESNRRIRRLLLRQRSRVPRLQWGRRE